ncbi:TetR/AcrR family transcriptional regulator [Agrococcus jejuensis]|uniref:TetR/AcrR family transcriptional regulator n=1 Tax=Agrococcus jejuensis TaxID=399736 RepID=UPI001560EB04|nr:TetR/AcrR family transcriptional regulator C-terminal domain-containing protein [Agrococcus jejuensis]
MTQERIIDAAFGVLADRDADEFTMSRLAERLGVRPSALYNHVHNRQALVNLLRRSIAAEIDSSAFEDRPWDEAIEPWARSYREVFARHPQVVALLATVAMDGNETSLHLYEPIVLGFQRGGWETADIVPVIVALESFIIGSSLDVIADPENMSPGANAALAPAFSAAVRARDDADAASGVSHADRAFELGLAAMVAGLRARMAAAG